MRVRILETDLFLRGNQCKEMRLGVIRKIDDYYKVLRALRKNRREVTEIKLGRKSSTKRGHRRKLQVLHKYDKIVF